MSINNPLFPMHYRTPYLRFNITVTPGKKIDWKERLVNQIVENIDLLKMIENDPDFQDCYDSDTHSYTFNFSSPENKYVQGEESARLAKLLGYINWDDYHHSKCLNFLEEFLPCVIENWQEFYDIDHEIDGDDEQGMDAFISHFLKWNARDCDFWQKFYYEDLIKVVDLLGQDRN
jgi:hypothetical protein